MAHRLHVPVQETWARSLGREDPLEKGVAIQSSIVPGESLDGGAWRPQSLGHNESDRTEHSRRHAHATLDPL